MGDMANAQIHFTQGASSPGAGYAMLGTTGTGVTVSNGDDSNVENWQFTVIDVGTGSEVAQGIVQDGETPTYSFTPDATGCYVIQLETTDDDGNVYLDQRVFGVPLPDPDNDWPTRFEAACSVAGDDDALAAFQKTGRMVALKDSAVWQALGDGAGSDQDRADR